MIPPICIEHQYITRLTPGYLTIHLTAEWAGAIQALVHTIQTDRDSNP